MIRPIDTQTIYQQTQEISSRQQMQNQMEQTQQGQFSHIMQKETQLKKESINKLEQDNKVDNDLDKQQGKGKYKQEKNKKGNKETPEEAPKNIKLNKFDMSI